MGDQPCPLHALCTLLYALDYIFIQIRYNGHHKEFPVLSIHICNGLSLISVDLAIYIGSMTAVYRLYLYNLIMLTDFSSAQDFYLEMYVSVDSDCSIANAIICIDT